MRDVKQGEVLVRTNDTRFDISVIVPDDATDKEVMEYFQSVLGMVKYYRMRKEMVKEDQAAQ
jgi:hypothetical protein